MKNAMTSRNLFKFQIGHGPNDFKSISVFLNPDFLRSFANELGGCGNWVSLNTSTAWETIALDDDQK